MYLGLQKYSLVMYNVVTHMVHWPVATGTKSCIPGHTKGCWDSYSANIMLICFSHAKYVGQSEISFLTLLTIQYSWPCIVLYWPVDVSTTLKLCISAHVQCHDYLVILPMLLTCMVYP